MLFLQALSFSCRLLKYYIMIKTPFTVHQVASLIKSGEWNKKGILLASPNYHELGSVDDSGDEDYWGMLSITQRVYLSGRYWKMNTLCNASTLLEVFKFFPEKMKY